MTKGRQGRKVQSKRVVSSSSTGFAPANGADLTVKPPNPFNVPKRVPRNVAALVAWDTVKFDTGITLSTSAVVETNYSFNLTMHPQYTSWTTLFDQWSIPQVSITFQSQMSPGSTTGPTTFHTALDFDNTTAINTVAAIEDYATCNSVVMQPQSRFTRSVRPTTKAYSTSGGSGTVALITGPQWVDCAVPGVPFYGIRSIAQAAGSDYVIMTTTTIWFCFRNQI
jgi:hypothetical protein